MIKISYAIPVCNEHVEINRLLHLLSFYIRKEDEVIVQCDKGNTTPEVYDVLKKYDFVKVIEYALNNNFADFKNNLNNNCTGDWIFQIDADETPDASFLSNLPDILQENFETTDAFWVPRKNRVFDITPEHIQKWRWRVDEHGYINYPDYQMRLYKNKDSIRWTKSVHEQLIGYKTFSSFPDDYGDLCLWHHKGIKRQEKQNEFYEGI